MERVSEYSEELYTATDKCPICGSNTLTVKGVVYHVPYYGRILIESVNCTNCGYKDLHITYLDATGPIRIEYRVTDRDDIEHAWIIRSSEAKVYSPDLGFILAPGSAGEAMITPLEGLMYRLLAYAEAMGELQGEAEARRRKFIDDVNKALRGELEFTIVIEDPTGSSMIKPPEGREGKLRVVKLA